MDIEDRGPVLNAGAFALRVSNIGVLGNPWFDVGRSFDPSFEWPRGTGQELLGSLELWVGAQPPDGEARVSGGPMYEWRPTIAPADRVRRFEAGTAGGSWKVDDDGDGRTDEDPPNGRDDDGDGRVDEDFDLPSQELLTAEFTDNQPEAVAYDYPQGERHVPLGLAVHQEVMAWTRTGSDGIAGIRYVVTNISSRTLRDVRLGVLADLDSRRASERAGQLNDRIERRPYVLVVSQPDAVVTTGNQRWRKHCSFRIEGEVVLVRDGLSSSGLPASGILGIAHTTDPLAQLRNTAFSGVREALGQVTAPGVDTTFHSYVFARDLPPQQGGIPVLDRDRWAAMHGGMRVAPENQNHDYVVLLTCGPFLSLAPMQSVEFSVALIAAADAEGVEESAVQARLLGRGEPFNLDFDLDSDGWSAGDTGINGHEICLEPPPGVIFHYDPHCPEKFTQDADLVPESIGVGPGVAFDVTYSHGHCVWTDLDCDACTGNGGSDHWHRWASGVLLPPAPSVRVTARDHAAIVEWDDRPEAALAARLIGDEGYSFAGYRVYRLDDWTRTSLLPPPERWQRMAVYRPDTTFGGLLLDDITDNSVAAIGDLGGRTIHAVGRYRFVDHTVLDGFDYHYVVTSVLRAHAPHDTSLVLGLEQEGPFVADFASHVTPRVEAVAGSPRVWVVPNPYRAHAEWERPAVPGDVFTRHLDFMGLPRERCVVRVYTVAGDLVVSLDHDGSRGDGQLPWNLISRNGQDVVSGIYLFTVDGPSGHQVGKFVIMR